MALGFVPGKKSGEHYDLCMFALKKAKRVNLLVKGQTERHFEHTIVSHLQSSPRLRKNLITQIGLDEVEKISKSKLFGFSHWPDVSIGNDGTAMEIKSIHGGPGVRDILGQAIAYRMHYRFVILILVDQSDERRMVELCQAKDSQEYSLLTGLADEMNIFSIVGPVAQSKNLVFSGRRLSRAAQKKPNNGHAATLITQPVDKAK